MLGALRHTGIFWFRFHCWGVRVVPRWAIAPLIVFFTTFFYFALWRTGRAVASNLDVVLGPCGFWRRQQRKYRVFWNFAWCLTERYERFATERPVHAVLRGDEIWHPLLAGDTGILLVTAHIGHWETGSLTAAKDDEQRHVNVVREEELDPRSQAFTQELFDKSLGGGVTMHFAGDPMLGMKMLTALRRGEIVATQGDRPRTGGRSITALLFGQPTELPAGPPALARAAGVPLVPVFVFRRGRSRSEVVVRQPIPVSAERHPEALEAIAQRLADELEWAIRQAPYQWFCFQDLWSGEPPLRPARGRR